MALTTQALIEQRLQWDITADPETVITNLIDHATAIMEAEVGRPLESATYTDQTFDPPGGALPVELPNTPVTSVTSVSVDGTALTVADDVIVYPDGRLYRATSSRERWWGTSKRRSIVVTYVGGYLAGTHDSELAHLAHICTEMVARAFRNGAASAAVPAGVGMGGIVAVNLAGSDTVTYGTASGTTIEHGGGLSRFLLLFDDERRDLARYKPLLVA